MINFKQKFKIKMFEDVNILFQTIQKDFKLEV